MIRNERLEFIIEILEKQQFVSATHLAELTGCSVATIRRDFDMLAEDNLLAQIRGGAQAINNANVELDENNSNHFYPYVDAHDLADKKRVIAQKAIDLCSDGESIFIGDGDCTNIMAEFLADLRLNILTNSLILASELTHHNGIQCSLLGGVLNPQKAVIPGKNEEVLIPYYPCGKVFITTSDGADSEPSLNLSETGILRKLRAQAGELIVLCESSKLGINADLIINSLTDGDVLITDDAVDPALLSRFRELGIRSVVADAH